MKSQAFRLDRPACVSYYLAVGAVLVLSGCARLPETIAPVGLVPGSTEQVTAWLEDFVARDHRLYRARWLFQNDKGSAGGRISIRVAPPDSMRLDLRAGFGRSGAAAVVGDSVLWAKPDEDDFRGLLEVRPVFWAALGILEPPEKGTQVFTLETANFRAWQYVTEGDTLNFVHQLAPEPVLRAEMRRAGKPLAITEVMLDSLELPVESRLDFPLSPSRFTFTVRSIVTDTILDAGIWVEPSG